MALTKIHLDSKWEVLVLKYHLSIVFHFSLSLLYFFFFLKEDGLASQKVEIPCSNTKISCQPPHPHRPITYSEEILISAGTQLIAVTSKRLKGVLLAERITQQASIPQSSHHYFKSSIL